MIKLVKKKFQINYLLKIKKYQKNEYYLFCDNHKMYEYIYFPHIKFMMYNIYVMN